MYKPPKKEEPQATARVKLPMLSAMPSIKQMRNQLDEAKLRHGSIIEQQWNGGRPNQTFNLMVSWEKTAQYPVWTLYEENGADSKMHWSQPFHPAEVEMLYDIMAMSCDSGAATKIPDALRPKDEPEKSEKTEKPAAAAASSAASSQSAASKTPSWTAPTQAPPAQPAYTPPAPAPAPYTPPAQPAYPPPAPQPPYPQAGYPNPAAYPAANPGYPGGYPQQAPPGYGYGGYPPPQPQPAYPQAAPAANPWAQSASPPGGSVAPELSPVKGPIPPELNLAKGGRPTDLSGSGVNILMGTLLFEAGFINQNTLEAALKLQEMVRDAKISAGDAPEFLKRLHSMGANIDEYVNKTGGAPASPTGSTSKTDLAEQRSVFDLLQKAGLLKEDDVKSATQVRSKHGGDLVQILQAANKLDPTTYKAAATCVPLIRDNKMKVEQCIIALNFCNRSRVDFDTALEELGLPNPLK